MLTPIRMLTRDTLGKIDSHYCVLSDDLYPFEDWRVPHELDSLDDVVRSARHLMAEEATQC